MYRDSQKKDPPQFSAQAFSGIQVFVEALSALDKKSPLAKMDLAALRIELNKQLIAGTYDTPLGEISFNGLAWAGRSCRSNRTWRRSRWTRAAPAGSGSS